MVKNKNKDDRVKDHFKRDLHNYTHKKMTLSQKMKTSKDWWEELLVDSEKMVYWLNRMLRRLLIN